MGRSRGGPTTKIHMQADALGRPLGFVVTACQVGDITQVSALLGRSTAKAVLTDKGYDSNALREIIAAMGAEAVILSNRTCKLVIAYDEATYKYRNCIERCFGCMKHFRHFATRYERRTIHFAGFVYLVAVLIWMP